jgi:hypothetical protein
MLTGSLKYLGFNVGQALEPLAAWLVPIIDRVSEWVLQNQELVAGFVKWGFIVGTLMLIGGQIITFVTGLSGAVAQVGFLTTAWTTLSGAIAASPLLFSGIALGAVAAIWVAWQTDLGDIRDGVRVFFKDLTGFVDAWSKNSKEAFSGFSSFVTGLVEGDFKKTQDGLSKFLLNIGEITMDLMGTVSAGIINGFIFIWNAAIDITAASVKLMLGWIESLIEAYNAVPFLADVDTSFIQTLKDSIDIGADKLKVDYVSYQEAKAEFKAEMAEQQRQQQVNMYFDKFEVSVAEGQDPIEAFNQILGQYAANQ